MRHLQDYAQKWNRKNRGSNVEIFAERWTAGHHFLAHPFFSKSPYYSAIFTHILRSCENRVKTMRHLRDYAQKWNSGKWWPNCQIFAKRCTSGHHFLAPPFFGKFPYYANFTHILRSCENRVKTMRHLQDYAQKWNRSKRWPNAQIFAKRWTSGHHFLAPPFFSKSSNYSAIFTHTLRSCENRVKTMRHLRDCAQKRDRRKW